MMKKISRADPLDSLPDIPFDENLPQRLDCTAKNVLQLIGSLPEGQQRVMKLRCIDDLDNDEIARITGYSEGNVRQLLSRARKCLRKYFDDEK